MENISIDPSIKSAVATFAGFLELSAHKNIGKAVLDIAIKNGISKLIVDNTNLQIVRPETQAWMKEEWFPEIISSGIKFLAYVVSKDEIGSMNASNQNLKSENIEIQYVDSLANAKAWMSKK